MSDPIARGWVEVWVDGCRIRMPEGATVAAAVLRSTGSFRRSLAGQPRGPLCGMGTCFECRVRIDGQAPRRSCNLTSVAGMRIETAEAEA